MIGRRPTKLTVEECRPISANDFKELLRSGWGKGTFTWKTEDEDRGKAAFLVQSTGDKLLLWAFYTITSRETGNKTDYNYSIPIQTTQPHFGGVRYWFTCTLIIDGEPCNRRVGKLYLPPGGHYFGCRHCYDLTYRSCQDSHKFDRLYEEIAGMLSRHAPEGFPINITPKLIKESLREEFDE